jgi:dTDP-glucose pyrophosphorylase
MKAVILSAGSVPHEITALFRCPSVGLIPINGRPLIALQIDFLRSLGATEIKVALRSRDTRLREYLVQYSRLFEVPVGIVEITSDRGPGGTMVEALKPEDFAKGALVLLGDTLIERDGSFALGGENSVFTSSVEEPQRWCMVSATAEGAVTKLVDKPAAAESAAEAAVGCYWFGRVEAATWTEITHIPGARIEISAILERVRIAQGLSRRSITGWLDCGNVDLLVATRRRMIAARSFNSLVIDELRGTVRKRSTHGDKFRHEINYYRLLPDDLAVFFPRLISHETSQPDAHVELEYYAYPTISEVYIYEEYGDSFWSAVIDKLGAVLAEFSKRRAVIKPADCAAFYTSKLSRRLEESRAQSGELGRLLALDELKINGAVMRGVPALWDSLLKALAGLSDTVSGAVIHGDLCFANILLEPLNKTLRLIDPRGSFHEVGVFGDSRYDHAKLWHSVDGHYDAIINDMFSVKVSGDTAEFDCYRPRAREQVLRRLEAILPAGVSRREVRIIEGSLFLSMLPLHADHPRRQLAMLFSGLCILNEEL